MPLTEKTTLETLVNYLTETDGGLTDLAVFLNSLLQDSDLELERAALYREIIDFCNEAVGGAHVFLGAIANLPLEALFDPQTLQDFNLTIDAPNLDTVSTDDTPILEEIDELDFEDVLDRVLREDNQLSVFLQSLGNEPLLKPEEAIAYIKKYRLWKSIELSVAGLSDLDALERYELIKAEGLAAHDSLVVRNLKLVVYVARKYQNHAELLDILDLIQEGSIGLMRAIEKFDLTRGAKFSTYAVWWIRQAISRALSNTDRMIRLPENLRDLITPVQDIIYKFQQTHGNEPSSSELSLLLNNDHRTSKRAWNPQKVETFLISMQRVRSLNEPSRREDGEEFTLEDLIPDDVDIENLVASNELVQAARDSIEYCESHNLISALDAQILRMTHGFHDGEVWNQAKVARYFDISPQEVNRRYKKSWKTVKRSSLGARLQSMIKDPLQ